MCKTNGLTAGALVHLDALSLDPDLKELWVKKYKFYRSKLGLSDEKAIKSADRTVRIFKKVDRELAATG